MGHFWDAFLTWEKKLKAPIGITSQDCIRLFSTVWISMTFLLYFSIVLLSCSHTFQPKILSGGISPSGSCFGWLSAVITHCSREILGNAPKCTDTWYFSLWTSQLPWESECLTPKFLVKVYLPCGKGVSMATFTGGRRTYTGCAIRLLLHIICLKYVNTGLVILS